MRKTPLEIIDPNVSDDERHEWLATATLKELSEYLRWAKTESSWAQHGRDWLNIVLARENIKLQTAIKRLTIWLFILTLIMAIIGIIQIQHTDSKRFSGTDNQTNNTATESNKKALLPPKAEESNHEGTPNK